MSLVTVAYALAFYLAAALFVLGLAFKIVQYARTPAPLKIPTTPAPLTRSGAMMRVLWEVVFFRNLFKSNKWIWIFGWMFHLALALVLFRHLRYFLWPVPTVVTLAQPFGIYAAPFMVLGLLALLARRIVVERIRYISKPTDYLMLLLLLGIGISGGSMTFADHTDIISLKAFFLGLMHLQPQPLPTDPLLLIHLGLVATLLLVFPFSKLLHAPGIFFSPTLNQNDDARDRRHVAPWAAGLDATRGQ